MIAVLLLAIVGLPLLLTYRSPRWRRTGRVIALFGLLVAGGLVAAFVFGGVPVG